jgi:hypothetical protein
MRCAIFLTAILFATDQSCAGPIAVEFGSGFEGVLWGTSLTQLVGLSPDGEHYFSTAPGERVYLVRNNDPILGVPRAGTRLQYHLGKDGGVESIAVGVPYERRDQLLGVLLSLFGSYSATRTVGTAIVYQWQRDNHIAINVRASKDPTNGILEFWINHIDASKSAAQSK